MARLRDPPDRPDASTSAAQLTSCIDALRNALVAHQDVLPTFRSTWRAFVKQRGLQLGEIVRFLPSQSAKVIETLATDGIPQATMGDIRLPDLVDEMSMALDVLRIVRRLWSGH